MFLQLCTKLTHVSNAWLYKRLEGFHRISGSKGTGNKWRHALRAHRAIPPPPVRGQPSDDGAANAKRPEARTAAVSGQTRGLVGSIWSIKVLGEES